MIKLDAQYQTTVQTLSGSTVTSSVVTDTLLISNVQIDFVAGKITADILRGSSDGGFTPNASPVHIVVQSDGSFASADGSWQGTLSSMPAFLAQLKQAFDGFVLSSGLITGSEV